MNVRELRLLGLAEVADCLGVSRQRVYQLHRDHPLFPVPVAELRATKVWLAEDIEQFMKDWDRRPGRRRK